MVTLAGRSRRLPDGAGATVVWLGEGLDVGVPVSVGSTPSESAGAEASPDPFLDAPWINVPTRSDESGEPGRYAAVSRAAIPVATTATAAVTRRRRPMATTSFL